jgi:glycosyltransferase involved in cell wall biosynthesis
LRILHIIATIDPEAGGPTEAVRVMLQYAPEGYRSEVLTLDDPSAGFLSEIAQPVIALGPRNSIYGYTPKLIPWLQANRDRFDGVVLHGLWGYCGFAVWRTLAGRVPYLVFAHGMLDPYFKRAFPRKHLKKWFYWLAVEMWMLRDAYRVLFTCETEGRLAKQSFWLHQWTPFVVPFGTVPPVGDKDSQRDAFGSACPGVRDKRFLLYLGRIHPKKGCDLLIDAFIKSAVGDPELHLVMAGPDPQNLRLILRQQIVAAGLADRVHWPGMLRGDTKWGAFHAAEAFILPSHQENFGIAVAEAMACGKPVLLSEKVNIAAEIALDGAGLVEADTAAGTERLLARWKALTDDERIAMGLRAVEAFHKRYDMRENAKVVPRLFENAAPPAKKSWSSAGEIIA